MSAKVCALIVLASGLSERFGAQNKLLASLGGKPVALHVIEAMASINFKENIAVIGGNPDVSALFKTAEYMCVANGAPEAGQGRSIAIGAQCAIDAGCNSACIVLADMPFITADHIKALLEASSKVGSVMSEYEGDRMPPAIFTGHALNLLVHQAGARGAKSQMGKDAATIAFSKRAAFDIDSKLDLETARTSLTI